MEKTSIVFLSVPPTLREKIPHMHFEHGESPDGSSADDMSTDDMSADGTSEEYQFEIDPSIPIPAELESGETKASLENLSWEMMLSGMLKVIAGIEKADVPPEWIDYYRNFVLAIKPEIYHEFTDATIVKTENGEFDTALEINAVLEGLFPRSPGILLNKALILESRAQALEKKGQNAEKENDEAQEAYETVLNVEPVLPDALFNAGFFFVRRKDFARARECFSRYISIEEDSGDSSESAAAISTEFSGEKLEQAKKVVKNIDEQGLEDESYRQAFICINNGDDEKGLAKIREFIERRPKVWNGWFVLGWALRKMSRYEDGLEAFKKAAELGGENGDVLNETAICMMELGDLKGAGKELERALRQEPENIKIISNLGVLALKAGKENEAKAFFRTVLELDPEDPLARRYLDNA